MKCCIMHNELSSPDRIVLLKSVLNLVYFFSSLKSLAMLARVFRRVWLQSYRFTATIFTITFVGTKFVVD